MTELAATVTRQSRWAGRGAIAAGVLVMAAALALALIWAQPPAPRAESVPADEFSADRAMAIIGPLLDDGTLHPVGTDANARVAARIIDELGGIGLQAETQETFACSSM